MKRLKENFVFFVGVFVIVFSIVFVFSAESETLLDVPNSAPYLVKDIPNQSWPSGTNLIDAFNLDDYFSDNEDSLTYYFTNVSDISIEISPNNSVSFFSESSSTDTKNVTFIASDGEENASSNLVYLFVGSDTIPPSWSNPRLDKSRIYQNSNVLFLTDWTDNFALSNYTLYLNQEGVWSEYSGPLSGASDTSNHSVKISSPAGKTVQWRFCASDTSLNTACTETYSFDVLVQPTNPPTSVSNKTPSEGTQTPSVGTTFYESIKELFRKPGEPDFTLNTNSFAVSLKQGESKTRVLEILNSGDDPLNFTLYIETLEDYVQLSEEYFELFPGETQTVTIDFRSSLDTPIGDYYGVLVVDSFKQARLPISLIVNDVDLEFEVIVKVLNEEKTVKPGKKVRANLLINSLKDQILTDAVLQYSIKDFEGNVYDSLEEDVSFDFSLSLEREFELSEEMPLGPYIFYARVYNEKASALDSDNFNVGTKFEFAAFLRTSFIFLFILIFSFLIFLMVFKYRRQLNKGKILNLYVKLNELRELINDEKYDQAANLYLNLKRFYGEGVSEELLQDKSKLAEEIKNLSKEVDLTKVKVPPKDEGKKGDKKEGEEAEEGEEDEPEGESKEENKDNSKEEKTEETKEEIKEGGNKVQKEEKKGETKEENLGEIEKKKEGVVEQKKEVVEKKVETVPVKTTPVKNKEISSEIKKEEVKNEPPKKVQKNTVPLKSNVEKKPSSTPINPVQKKVLKKPLSTTEIKSNFSKIPEKEKEIAKKVLKKTIPSNNPPIQKKEIPKPVPKSTIPNPQEKKEEAPKKVTSGEVKK